MADQVDAADSLPLAQNRLADGLFEQGVRYLQLDQHAGFRANPARQQLAVDIKYFCLGHFFGGGNQAQGFGGRRAIVEHHGRFHGVVDGAGDQVQVVLGVYPQGQHAEQGQGNTGQGHRYQRQDHMPAGNHRTQGRPHFIAAHEPGARRRDNCNTLGWIRTPLRATESRLTSNDTCSSLTRRQNRLPTVHWSPPSLMLSTG